MNSLRARMIAFIARTSENNITRVERHERKNTRKNTTDESTGLTINLLRYAAKRDIIRIIANPYNPYCLCNKRKGKTLGIAMAASETTNCIMYEKSDVVMIPSLYEMRYDIGY